MFAEMKVNEDGRRRAESRSATQPADVVLVAGAHLIGQLALRLSDSPKLPGCLTSRDSCVGDLESTR